MKDLLFHRKLIFFWGIILTSLILISSISLNIVQFLPGIIIMFLSYFSFYLGSRIKTYDFHKLSCEYWILKKINTKLSFGISIGFLIFTLFYIRYYTGQTPANVLLNLVLKNSNYELYQKFFLENEMSSFSLSKLPYILGYGIFKFLIAIVFIRLLGFQKKIHFTDYIYLLVILIAFLYMSIGRGTSFEIMEIFILFIFGYFLRLTKFKYERSFSLKNKILFLLFLIFSIILFNNNIESRGAGNLRNITNELFYKDNFLSSINPLLGILTFRLSGYFSFGLFFLSTLFYKITLGSFNGFIAFLSPFGSFLLGDKGYRSLICDIFIDCGVTWTPDFVSLLSYMGFIGVILFLFMLGKLSTILTIKTLKGSVIAAYLLFYIIYYTISLPVGNFITISSSNKIAIMLGIMFYVFPRINFIKTYIRTKIIEDV